MATGSNSWGFKRFNGNDPDRSNTKDRRRIFAVTLHLSSEHHFPAAGPLLLDHKQAGNKNRGSRLCGLRSLLVSPTGFEPVLPA